MPVLIDLINQARLNACHYLFNIAKAIAPNTRDGEAVKSAVRHYRNVYKWMHYKPRVKEVLKTLYTFDEEQEDEHTRKK